MNKITISNRFVLMIATMLPAIMLATSLTLSLVPTTTAFAQEDNEDSDNQSDINENEGGDNSVIVDPIVQPSVDVKYNVDVNTHVITDEEDCDEASDEVSQENDQNPSQEAGGEVDAGEDSITNIQVFQRADTIARNDNINTDATIPLS